MVSRATGTNTDSTALTTADTLYVDWAVINNGNAATAATFYTELYIDGVLQKSWNTPAPLNANASISVSDYSVGSLSAGTHTLKIKTDSTGVIAESSETDNEYTKTITVTVPNLPNLTPYQPSGWSDKIVVSRATGTNTDSTGLTTADTLYVDAAVVNNGTAPTTVPFITELYVDGVLKTSWTTSTPLSAGANAALSVSSISATDPTAAVAAQLTAFNRLSYARAWAGSLPPELARFRDWSARYFAVTTSTERTALEAEGLTLARMRRAAMRALIEKDPAQALAVAVPAAVRAKLPAAIVAELESRFSGEGDLTVMIFDYRPEEMARRRRLGLSTDLVQRSVQVEGSESRAFVYGRRVRETTKHGIPLHGVTLDGATALHESAVRVLEPGEPFAAGRPITDLTNGSAPSAAVLAELRGKLHRFASPEQVLLTEAQFAAAEAKPGPIPTPVTGGLGQSAALSSADQTATALLPATSWTTGNKKVLIIRVDFSDLPGDPKNSSGTTTHTATGVQNVADTQVKPYYAQSSYGLTSLTNTVTTQLYRLPRTAASYATLKNAGGTFIGNNQLFADARTAAAADYTLSSYDRVIVLFSSLNSVANSQITYGGLADVGGARVWSNGEFDFRVIAHELGHTYGLYHAALWQVSDGNPISANGSVTDATEYGDDFDTMGANLANSQGTDFNPYYKNNLGWVADNQVQTVTTSGTYRLNRLDNSTGTGTLGLKISRDSTRTYWIGVRRNFTGNASMQHGAYVIWGFNAAGSGSGGGYLSALLDLNTPGTNDQDAALAIGQTLTDTTGNVSIKLLSEGGTAPNEYVDVEVTVGLTPTYATFLDYNLGSLSAGTHTLKIKTDSSGVIAESNETDNEYTKTIAVLSQNTPPAITIQPADQTVSVGMNVTFLVAASGNPAPSSYQWQRRAVGTTGFVNLTDGGSYLGTNTGTLTVSAATVAMSGDQFQCVVSNGVSPNATSGAATLTVTQAPSFTSANSATFVAGQAGSFTVTAVGSPTPAFSATGLPLWASLGATTGVLSGMPPNAAGSPFTLTLMASNGVLPNATQVFLLTVQTPVIAPAITTQPQNQQVTEGGSVTFTVAASGTAPLSYQWKKGGADIAGATGSSYNIASALVADAGSYTVVVTNSAGNKTSDPAGLTVIPAGTSVTHAVVGAGYVAGGTVTISNTLTYTSTLTSLGWHVLLPTGWSFASDSGIVGATRPSVGTTAVLDWTWTSVPASPVTFTYTLNVPTGTTGDKEIVAVASLGLSSGPASVLVKPDPLVIGPATSRHTADTNGDGKLSLLELTRVIELYNTRNDTTRTGCYAVQAGSEDGFAPEPTRTSSATVTLASYHSADSDKNGKISLLELTRVIELYNYRSGTTRTGQYHVQAGTEDGFAPGP
jgi:M6 family metalloprotease-like protein